VKYDGCSDETISGHVPSEGLEAIKVSPHRHRGSLDTPTDGSALHITPMVSLFYYTSFCRVLPKQVPFSPLKTEINMNYSETLLRKFLKFQENCTS
jgi:hypothetical protein